MIIKFHDISMDMAWGKDLISADLMGQFKVVTDVLRLYEQISRVHNTLPYQFMRDRQEWVSSRGEELKTAWKKFARGEIVGDDSWQSIRHPIEIPKRHQAQLLNSSKRRAAEKEGVHLPLPKRLKDQWSKNCMGRGVVKVSKFLGWDDSESSESE